MKCSHMSPWRSLKTKVTLFTLGIFVVSLWSLSFYASRMLHEDMERLTGEQQLSVVSFIAEGINQEMGERLQALEKIAGSITPGMLDRPAEMLDRPAEMQALLEQRPLLRNYFNGGAIVLRRDGTAIADIPVSAGRIGVNYRDVDCISAVFSEGKSTVGRPVMGRKLHAPVFGMAVPIKNGRNRVVGALYGVTNLGKVNFLNKITENRYGTSGGYLLVAPKARMVVTATDKGRIMETLPAPGINPQIDSFMQGREGTAVIADSRGVEMLASVKNVPVSGWFIMIILPVEEAFAPISDMQRRMQVATILLTLLAGGLTWWMLKRQLSPLLLASRDLAAMSDPGQSLRHLYRTGQGEIDDLIGGFNGILDTLQQRDEALRQSEEKYRSLVETAQELVWTCDMDGCFTYLNPAWEKSHGYRIEEMLGKNFGCFQRPEVFERDKKAFILALAGGFVSEYETTHSAKDGRTLTLLFSAVPLKKLNGEIVGTQGTAIDITARKRAEEKLQDAHYELQTHRHELETQNEELRYTQHELDRSLARYLDLYDFAPVGYLTLDDKWIIQEANQRAAALLGTPATSLAGRSLMLYIFPEDQDAFYLYRKKLQKTGATQRCELRIHTMDGGDHFWAQMESIAVQDTERGSAVFRVTVSDITLRRKTEDALQENRLLLGSLINGITDCVYVKDLQGRYLLFNAAAEKTVGKSADEVMGKDDTFIFPPDEAALVMAGDRAVIGSGKVQTYEEQVTSAAGLTVTYLSTKGPLFDVHGKLIGIFGVARDITERKFLEDALRESEERFRNMANTAPVLIWISGADKLCYWFNQVWLDYTGRTMEQERGNGWAEGVHPDDVSHCLETYVTAFENRQEFSMEYRLRRADGQYRWLVDHGTPSFEHGLFTGYIGSCTDITECKRMEYELRQALDAAKVTTATMTRLLRTVAHEFRTPLGLLTGSADILDRYWDRLTFEKRFEQNENIRSAARQMANLVNSMISFNVSGTYSNRNTSRQLDIGCACAAIAAEVEVASGAGQRYSIAIDAGCGTARLDETVLRRILENLLTNAFRYTPSDGTVSLHVSRDMDVLYLEVADTGIGIPEGDTAHIFEAFYRSSNVESRRGLGLGLSIVNEALLQLNGTITVTSKAGEGTVMWVALPVGDEKRMFSGALEASEVSA